MHTHSRPMQHSQIACRMHPQSLCDTDDRLNKFHGIRISTSSAADATACIRRCDRQRRVCMCAAETPAAQQDELRAIAADYSRLQNRAAPAQELSADTSGCDGDSVGGCGGGMCHLVGAGPGGLEHLTVCALHM